MTGQPRQGWKAMIFAAGFGTRLKPFTDKHPKALAPVNGKPLLQHTIEYLSSQGVRSFIINVHHFADQITDFLDGNNSFGLDITLSHEVEEPLETGGGLMKAAWFFKEDNEPFIVMNADILTDMDIRKMMAEHKRVNPLVSLAVTNRTSSRSFLFNENQVLCGWKNNKTGEERIARPGEGHLIPASFTCVHIIEPAMLGMIRQNGKFSIIDTYLDLARENHIHGYFHNQDCVIDVGKPESIAEAEKYFR